MRGTGSRGQNYKLQDLKLSDHRPEIRDPIEVDKEDPILEFMSKLKRYLIYLNMKKMEANLTAREAQYAIWSALFQTARRR